MLIIIHTFLSKATCAGTNSTGNGLVTLPKVNVGHVFESSSKSSSFN